MEQISVVKDRYVLLYNKSKTILVDVDNFRVVEIPVGAERMYFEKPFLLALDGTTFTKYDICGRARLSYTFLSFKCVVPSEDWDSFCAILLRYFTCQPNPIRLKEGRREVISHIPCANPFHAKGDDPYHSILYRRLRP